MKKTAAAHSEVGNRILIGLVVGTLIGVLFNLWGEQPARNWILVNAIQPIGTGFLRGLFAIIIPLVFSSLALGVATIGSVQHLSRLGWRLALFYLGTTFAAAVTGIFLVNLFKPGLGLDSQVVEMARAGLSGQVQGLLEKSQGVSESLWPGLVSKIIPRNITEAIANANMLGVIFCALVFGVALHSVSRTKAQPVIHLLEVVTEVCMNIVGWVMRHLAPYCIAALMVTAVSQFGAQLMVNLLKYMGVVVLGCGLHFFLTYPLLIRLLVQIPLSEFYRRGLPAISMAFSSASSSATMPMTMQTLRTRFGLPSNVVTFSVPLGTTVNMDGTAIFSTIAALFIAQIFGVEIALGTAISLVFIILFTSIGVAGVPGGLYPLLMAAMASVGIPPEGIAIILGVDRLLDMCRTAVNVTGDMACALYLAKQEKVPLQENLRKIRV